MFVGVECQCQQGFKTCKVDIRLGVAQGSGA